MDNMEFKAGREKLGLTLDELGKILDTAPRTIRKWEADPSLSTARSPSPIASRVLSWMLDGYRPPQFPEKKL